MKTVRNSYALEFRVLAIDMDAAYFYTPGKIDLIVIHKGFESDNFLIAQFISFLQRDIALKMKVNKKNEQLFSQCVIGDLDLDREPDFVIKNLGEMEEIDCPGEEIVLIGRAGQRKSIKTPISEVQSYQPPKLVKGFFETGATYTIGDPDRLAFWDSLEGNFDAKEMNEA